MAFRLSTVRTGAVQVFSIQTILALLGDAINDEIELEGDAYRISSYDPLDGELPTVAARADWKKIPLTITSPGQTHFPFEGTDGDPEGMFLVVNGLVYDYGVQSAFHLDNAQIYWHGGFELDPTDILYIKQLVLTL